MALRMRGNQQKPLIRIEGSEGMRREMSAEVFLGCFHELDIAVAALNEMSYKLFFSLPTVGGAKYFGGLDLMAAVDHHCQQLGVLCLGAAFLRWISRVDQNPLDNMFKDRVFVDRDVFCNLGDGPDLRRRLPHPLFRSNTGYGIEEEFARGLHVADRALALALGERFGWKQ